MLGVGTRPGDTEDLSSLSNLNEAILLEELKIRYSRDLIYTYVGDILVALNPFKSLYIYLSEYQKRYRNARMSQNPPHIFAIADISYQQVISTGRSQCCVISGESGAGKTESAKLIVSQLMYLSGSRTVLEQKILQANPLLEAFGNARTVINNNSSRFGKYLQLKFKDGCVTGAKINEYLLEKSRVVSQNANEQNFHIFYSLIAGLDSERKKALGLICPSHFHYLQRREALSSVQEEKKRFSEVCNAFDLVGFETDLQQDIFTCLGGILHLGNIEFHEDTHEYSYVLEPRSGPVQTVSELLGIDVHHLVDVLTVSVSFARGEAIRKHLSKQGSLATRDALSKSLYDRIFRWIVNRINHLLAPTAQQMTGEREIGILDIFGFEKFENNSFEQMCINMANEQLQHFFIEHIFLLEKEEYKKEGLGSLDIQFQDNKPLLELFFSKPIGIFALLDEQCSFPQATERSFIVKLSQNFKKKKSLFIPSKDTSSCCFSIIHYAGKVEYNSVGFLDKNRDSMPNEAITLLKSSTNDLIKLIFTANITRTGTLELSRLTAQRLRKKGRPSKRGNVHKVTSKPLTIGAQFKNSLSVLTEKLNAGTPHFVRCIKPNSMKSPGNFSAEIVVDQLRYTGMLETVRIRKEGYPFRPAFEEFLIKFGTITTAKSTCSLAENCQRILQRAGLDGFKIGKSKVLLKHHHLERLDSEIDRQHKAVIMLQKIVRGFVQRSKFQSLLAQKQEQEDKVTEFLLSITSVTDDLIMKQLALCNWEEENPRPTAPPLEFLLSTTPPELLTPSPLPSAPPFSYFLIRSQPLPPPDFNMPPPEPKFSDSEEDECIERGEDILENDTFIAPPQNSWLRSFGREGTKIASFRWFEETQAKHLLSSTGSFPNWFHGMITRQRAKKQLAEKPEGTFLIRICENRFGFSLCVIDRNNSVIHLMISQLETGKYMLIGEPKVHSCLSALVFFHYKVPIHQRDGGSVVLTCPCDVTNPMSSLMTSQPNSSVVTSGPNLDVTHSSDMRCRFGRKRIMSVQCTSASGHGKVWNDEGSQRTALGGRKPKISRTRSHDPKMGYGALKHYIARKSTIL